MRVCSLAFAAIVGFGLVGCGDDDGGSNQTDAGVNQNDASTNDDGGSNNNNNNNTGLEVLGDLDGPFEFTSMSSPYGNSTLTFTRTETVATVDGSTVALMLRGYMDFTASDDASGVAEMQLAPIVDHRPYNYYGSSSMGISLEASGGKLIWHWPGMDIVFLTDYDGTVLTLTLDENDVRNADLLGDFTEEYVLTRFTPTANELTGSWSYKSMTISSGGGSPTTITDTCTSIGSGQWQRLSGTFTANDRGFYRGQVLFTTYDDNACSNTPTDTEALEFVGFSDVDETNDVIEMYQWMVTEGRGVGATFDYTLNGTTCTMDLDTIYPPGEGGATQTILEKL